jgi:hypothetical protein
MTPERGNSLSPERGVSLTAYSRKNRGKATTPWDPISGKSAARVAELSGAPRQTVRALEELPGYQDRVAAAEALGDIQTEPPKGAVASILNFIDRPRSAIVGALSGITGQERLGEDEDLITGSRYETARRRFAEGLSGEDQFFASDFGVIGQKPGKDASLLARGFNAGAGFIIDTVFDPITYMSFGGSIFGRRVASEMVQAASEKTLRTAIGSNSFNADKVIFDAIQKNTHKSTEIVNKLKVLQKEAYDAGGLSGQAASKLGKLTVDRDISDILKAAPTDWKRKIALDIAPDVAAGTYAGYGGSAALRRWAVSMFGDDLGEAYFRSLPRDLQGGIRIRMPFVRDASGNVVAFGIPGVGAGRLADKSKVVSKALDLTEEARSFLGTRMRWFLERMGGKNGDQYFDYIAAARGKIDKSGAVSYSMYKVSQQATRRLAQARQIFDDSITQTYVQSDVMYTDGLEKYGEAFADAWRTHFYRTKNTTEGATRLREANKKMGAEGAKLAEDTARLMIELTEGIGKMHVDAFGDARRAFTYMKDWAPRQPTSDEAARRYLGSSSTQKGGSASYMKHRQRWAAALYLDETGDVGVIRWMDNVEVNKFLLPEARDVYLTDPREFMPIWIQEARSNLIDQYVVNFYIKSGVLANADKVKNLDGVNYTLAWQRYMQLRGTGDPGSPDFQPGLFDKILNEIKGETNFTSALSRASSSDSSRPEIVAAERVAKIFQREGIPGVVFRADFDIYDALDVDTAIRLKIINSKREPNIQSKLNKYKFNRWDGTLIHDRSTTNVSEWMILDRELKPVSSQIFRTAQEAEQQAQAVFTQLRDNNYFDWSTAFFARFKELADEAYMTTPGQITKLLAPEGMDPSELPEHLNKMIEHIMSVLERTGRVAGSAEVTSGKNLALLSPSVREISTDTTPQFFEFLKTSGYTDIFGADFARGAQRTGVAGSADPRTRVAVEMADMYGPRKLMDSLNTMFRAYKDPGNEFLKFYENVYMPYYRTAKVWMTLGRGPGFVLRNLNGGMWNLHINQVGSVQANASAALQQAKMHARERVKKALGPQAFDERTSDAAALFKEEFSKIIKNRYKDSSTFIDGMNDGDALIEIFELLHLNGLDSGRETARVLGTILDSGRNRTGYPMALRRKREVEGKVKTVNDFIEMTPGGASAVKPEEMTKYQRAIALMTDENPWIRAMSNLTGASEDFLRTAAYIKGVQEFGLETAESGIRGYRASLTVKATQFDYSDLSAFERDILKALLPFYTWTRYNLPMQIRLLLHEPGKVAQAIRFNGELARMFSEPSDDGYPYASYVDEKFGWVMPESKFDWLPGWLQPQGDVSMGIVWGEPVADVNRLFRSPGAAAGALGPSNFLLQAINTRELGQNLNPLAPAVFSAWGASAYASDPSVMPGDREKAMGWLRLIGWQKDPNTGDPTASRAIADSIRAIFPMVGLLERNFPQAFGGERQQGRQFTSLIGSSLLGLPMATEDEWKAASEMRRRSQFIKQQIDARYGESADTRMEAVRALRAQGAGPEEIRLLGVGSLEDDEVDVGQLVSLWKMLRRVNYLREAGISEHYILAGLQAYVPDGVKVSSAEEILLNYYTSNNSDRTRRIRQFGLKAPDSEQLEKLGYTEDDIRNMTREEREQVIREIDPRL